MRILFFVSVLYDSILNISGFGHCTVDAEDVWNEALPQDKASMSALCL